MKQMSFVVTVQFPEYLEENHIRNYVNMAIKKYEKLSSSQERSPYNYFDNVSAVNFNISEIKNGDEGLRDIVAILKSAKLHFDKIDLGRVYPS